MMTDEHQMCAAYLSTYIIASHPSWAHGTLLFDLSKYLYVAKGVCATGGMMPRDFSACATGGKYDA